MLQRNNIYNNIYFKYPLSNNEVSDIDNAWEFFNLFNTNFVFVTDYRRSIIKKIKNKYSIEQFMKYEQIMNKLYWNLRYILMPLFSMNNLSKQEYDNIMSIGHDLIDREKNNLLSYKTYPYKDNNDLSDKLKNNVLLDTNYYRSFLNKLVIIDKQKKIIIKKSMEGSSDIFEKNRFNLLTWTILSNKESFENVVTDPYNIKYYNIILPEHYYQCDYPFPNINPCVYSFGSENDKRVRIKKMYYDNDAEKWWFNIIN